MFRLLLITGVSIGLVQASASAQATQPADDAATLYLHAAKIVDDDAAANLMSPASSTLTYPHYPPFPAEWQTMEKADFAAHGRVRTLAHQARSLQRADWPALKFPNPDYSSLNQCRSLANELADAAVYQHLQGDAAAAIETLRDLLHMADLLQNPPGQRLLVQWLVSLGVRSMVMDRLNVISSTAALTSDPRDGTALQVGVARELMGQLLHRGDAKTEVADAIQADKQAQREMTQDSMRRLIETDRRVNTECDLAAMSLACHLYRFDTGRWPETLNDIHGVLPTIPIDPYGDGTQTLGYVLIKGGLPDGSDRPMVYSRCRTKDGLFFATDQPHYSFYNGDGTSRPVNEQKQGGQFRDVAGWAPMQGSHPAPATQPLR